MKIQLNEDHVLVSDAYCCWIEEKKVSEKGKNKGEEYYVRVSGYHGSLDQAVKCFIDRRVLGSGADSIKALNEEIEALKAEVKQMCRGFDKKLKAVKP